MKESTMRTGVAIYARVSTDDQAERGYSLPNQIEACQRFAEQREWEVTAVYQDDISGAKPIKGRPEGSQLQMAIDARQLKAVLIYRIDRLSRDIVDLLGTVRDWLRAGVEIYALDVGQVTSELDIVLVIKGWQGSDERKKIIERTSTGRYGKAKSGKAVGAGTPPYGYSYADGELFIDESQAKIVRLIFGWYVNGDESGHMMSIKGIARRLTDMGMPTPSEAKGWNKKRIKSCTWGTSVVLWLIKSETYCGVLHYGKYIGANGRGGRRPTDELITIEVPAIISRETWELAQERRAFNSRIAKRRTKREYLLRGLIYCGCGRHMVGTKGRYYCTRRSHFYESDQCHEPLVIGKIVEPITWDYIMDLISSPERFEQKLREAQAQEASTMQPKQNELEHILALLQDTEIEAEEIARASVRAKGIVAASLDQQADEVNRRYQALLDRKSALEQALTFDLTDDNIEDFLIFRGAVADGLDHPTFQDKRRWLELLQVTVTVTDRKAVIRCRISSKSVTVPLDESPWQGGGSGGGGLIELQTSASLKMERRWRS